MKRRSFLLGGLAAPAVVLAPDVLMRVRWTPIYSWEHQSMNAACVDYLKSCGMIDGPFLRFVDFTYHRTHQYAHGGARYQKVLNAGKASVLVDVRAA